MLLLNHTKKDLRNESLSVVLLQALHNNDQELLEFCFQNDVNFRTQYFWKAKYQFTGWVGFRDNNKASPCIESSSLGWEINCLSQLRKREIKKSPALVENNPQAPQLPDYAKPETYWAPPPSCVYPPKKNWKYWKSYEAQRENRFIIKCSGKL